MPRTWNAMTAVNSSNAAKNRTASNPASGRSSGTGQ
jgi:hypothetical protein